MNRSMDLLEHVRSLSFPTPLPQTLHLVEQQFDAPRLNDVAQAARRAMAADGLLAPVRAGDHVAVAVGSRGIRNLPLIVREVLSALRARGAVPFIVPAMGSHGGATPAGQRQMLHELGVTEEAVGAEIRATMDVVRIGQVAGGPCLYQDAHAAAADHTFLVARVKPHTDFHGALESGLTKMCAIGLGKRTGAEAMHALGAAGFRRFLAPAARVYERASNVIGGLGIVENALDETAEIHGVPMRAMGTEVESALLERARTLMARLPFDHIDVLAIRQIGKDISGTGMDTNIVGRVMIPRQPESGHPDVAVIAVLDLSASTHGNAAGMGLANVVSHRVVAKTDWTATYTNSITSGIFGMWRVSMPITMADDRRTLEVAVRCCGEMPERARIVCIEDTLHIDRLWVSESLLEEVRANPRLRVVGSDPLAFREDGAMEAPWPMA